MQVGITVTGLEAIQYKLDRLAKSRPKINAILKETAGDLERYAKQRIETSTDPTDIPYEPSRNPKAWIRARKKRKLRPPYRLLQITGNLKRSIFARAVDGAIEFGTGVGYSIYHQGDTKNHVSKGIIPRRAFFPLTEKLAIETRGSAGKFRQALINKLLAIIE